MSEEYFEKGTLKKMDGTVEEINILKIGKKILTEEQIIEYKCKIGECYEKIIEFLGEWQDITEEYKKIISLWIIGTYFHKTFNTYPYLFFNAMKGSGKTRLLRIISFLQKNGTGDVMTNPSESVMFRTAQDRGLILDEMESEKSKDKQTMREYLNACYKKGGIVFRMEKQKINEKEKQVAVGHNLFTPVAMANINGIEDVLADRSIWITLEKSNNPALIKKIEDFEDNLTIKNIKRTLEEFSVGLCNVELPQKVRSGWNLYISDRYITSIHTLPTIHYSTQLYTEEENEIFRKIDDSGITGRNLELFFPLLITSKIISSFIFDDILKIVIELNKNKNIDEFNESKDVSLIEFVSKAERYRFEFVFVNQLFKEFKEFIGTQGEEEDKWITSIWLGLAMKRLKLFRERRRVAKGIMVLLNIDNAKAKLLMFKDT